ncbi:MAG: Nudix family hydrolase [Gammaproteobacteria bacterium]
MPNTAVDYVHVAVGVIVNDGKVLIAKRPDHLHQGGKWEFPGGKVEAGETVRQALRREFEEELGIRPQGFSPLIRIRHRYADKRVLLDVWEIHAFRGEPMGREGQPLQWVARANINSDAFPRANKGIVNALKLPSEYLITPEPGHDWPSFLSQLERALERGVRLVQLRAKTLDKDSYIELAREALARCRAHDVAMLINGEPEWVERIGAKGVHLTSARLWGCTNRPLPEDLWVAASCHDEHEVAHANGISADFIVAGPVDSTPDHRGVPTLGWGGFLQLSETAAMPAFALGGMSGEETQKAREHGGQGIAAIRGLWGHRWFADARTPE